MKVQIKRVDDSLPLPAYHTKGAVAFDIYARETCVVPAHELFRIPSNLIVAIPEGYALIIAARSSLAAKKGLMMGNGIGIIDTDFRGPNDEILISAYNFTETDVAVDRGDRIAQGMFIRVEQAFFAEVANIEEIAADNRSGFGSTGGYKK